jgi:hypothetical protein
MEKQEILDWLDATADELAADLIRLRALRVRVSDGATLKRSDMEDLASVANNLDLDVASFQRRLPA